MKHSKVIKYYDHQLQSHYPTDFKPSMILLYKTLSLKSNWNHVLPFTWTFLASLDTPIPGFCNDLFMSNERCIKHRNKVGTHIKKENGQAYCSETGNYCNDRTDTNDKICVSLKQWADYIDAATGYRVGKNGALIEKSVPSDLKFKIVTDTEMDKIEVCESFEGAYIYKELVTKFASFASPKTKGVKRKHSTESLADETHFIKSENSYEDSYTLVEDQDNGSKAMDPELSPATETKLKPIIKIENGGNHVKIKKKFQIGDPAKLATKSVETRTKRKTIEYNLENVDTKSFASGDPSLIAGYASVTQNPIKSSTPKRYNSKRHKALEKAVKGTGYDDQEDQDIWIYPNLPKLSTPIQAHFPDSTIPILLNKLTKSTKISQCDYPTVVPSSHTFSRISEPDVCDAIRLLKKFGSWIRNTLAKGSEPTPDCKYREPKQEYKNLVFHYAPYPPYEPPAGFGPNPEFNSYKSESPSPWYQQDISEIKLRLKALDHHNESVFSKLSGKRALDKYTGPYFCVCIYYCSSSVSIAIRVCATTKEPLHLINAFVVSEKEEQDNFVNQTRGIGYDCLPGYAVVKLAIVISLASRSVLK